MRCEACNGQGGRYHVTTLDDHVLAVTCVEGVARWAACRECRGAGVVSCCEGSERQFGADVAPLFPAFREARP